MDSYVKKIVKQIMQFSWDVLQNMLENGASNMQTKFGVHTTLNVFKTIQFKITGSHQPPPPSNFKSLPYPRGRWYVHFFR